MKKNNKTFSSKFIDKKKQVKKFNTKNATSTDSKEVRLNKFIANCGVCSRREADVLIQAGGIQVNGKVVTTLGYRVKPEDQVKFDGQILKNVDYQYILLNKPKNFSTTIKKSTQKADIFQLIKNASKQKLEPLGRMGKDTLGLILFTNDTEVINKYKSGRYDVQKIYHVILEKPLKNEDLVSIAKGVIIEDKKIAVKSINFVEGKKQNEIGIELKTINTSVVKKIFELKGYQVTTVDRVTFAGITKKDLPRGKWRSLTENEIIRVRYFK